MAVDDGNNQNNGNNNEPMFPPEEEENIKASIFKIREYTKELKGAQVEAKKYEEVQRNIRQEKERVALAIEKVKEELEKLAAAENASSEEAELLRAQLSGLREEQQALNDDYNEASDQLRDLADVQRKTNEQLKIAKERLAGVRKAASAVAGEFNQLAGSASDLFALMVKQAHSFNQTSVELAKTTGYASAFHDNMKRLTDASNGLVISNQAAAEVIGALSTGYQDFNALTEQSQYELELVVGRLRMLGAGAAESAQALDLLENSLGMTREGARGALADFENLAMSIGRPVGSVIQDFNTLAPQLARFGDRGKEVFADLAEQARSLGLAVKDAFDISEMVDTFQGAADIAGKLNAQLGMQLNSVELMRTADADERLKIMRAEFDLQGMRFDQLSRREKQMVAEILQTDVGTAERLFGDPMEMRRFQRDQEAIAERHMKFVSATERLTDAFEQMFVKMEPILTSITNVIGSIAGFFSESFNGFSFLSILIGKIALSFKSFQTFLAGASKGLQIFKVIAAPIMGIIDAIVAYSETGDVGYAAAVGIGSMAGAYIGGFIGNLLLPGAGLIIGGIIGSMVGKAIGTSMYGGKPPPAPETINDGALYPQPNASKGFTIIDPAGRRTETNRKDAIIATQDIPAPSVVASAPLVPSVAPQASGRLASATTARMPMMMPQSQAQQSDRPIELNAVVKIKDTAIASVTQKVMNKKFGFGSKSVPLSLAHYGTG